MWRVFGAACATLALACGAPAAPRPVQPSTPEVHRYLPTDLREASRTAGVGLVIGSDQAGQSAVFELAPLPRRVAVTVARSRAGMAQLSLGAGGPAHDALPAATAVVGLPMLVARRTLGKAVDALPLDLAPAPSDIDLDVHGAALAAGWIAAAAGATPNPDVLVLGGLSLDGCVLPAPDAAAIVARAASAGLRVVGVAPGTAVAAGPGVNVQVVTILDVDDAYALLTGHALPRSQPLADADLVAPAAPPTDPAGDVARWLGGSPATEGAGASVASLTAGLLALEQHARTPAVVQGLARSGRSLAVEARHAAPPMNRLLARAALLRARIAVSVTDLLRAVDRGALPEALAMAQALTSPGAASDALGAAFDAVAQERLEAVRAMLDAPDAGRALPRHRRAAFVDAVLALATWAELVAAWRDAPDVLGVPAAAAAGAVAPADAALLAAALDASGPAPATLAAVLARPLGPTVDGLWLRDQARTERWVGADDGWPTQGAAAGPAAALVDAAANRVRVLAGRLRVLTGAVAPDIVAAYRAAADLPHDAGVARLLALRGFRRAAWLADLAVAAALAA